LIAGPDRPEHAYKMQRETAIDTADTLFG